MTTHTIELGLGDYLRRARIAAGLEQAEMAAKLGIARNTVSNWETGRSEPTFSQVVRWADETGAELEWFSAGVVRLKGLEPPTFWLGGTSPLSLSTAANQALDLALWEAELEEVWERALREWEERIAARESAHCTWCGSSKHSSRYCPILHAKAAER